ncbi:MAG: hypothetical protein DMH00_07815 [Acidobacteria bacterium]|nr:MAG: hypothetical protein DMH00_07815 [Acidobacteriota bacterium]
MADPSDPSMTTATEMNLRGRKVPGLLLLLAIASLLLFPLLGKQGLTDPDESAYVESVREMMDRGDWLVPRLYGQPILDKPILVYWVIGASFQLFGKSELSARLPTAMAALGLLFAVWRLGKLTHKRDGAGFLSALVLLSSLEFVLMGRAAVTDMFLTLFCTLGILCYAETLWAGGSRLLPLVGAACIGLAVLTKGPLGLLIPGMVLGACFVASLGRHRIGTIRPLASAAVFAAVTFPWYVAIAVLSPDLVKEFIVGGNLGRFLSAEHRPQPPLYYAVVLLIGFLPWSAFLPGALSRVLAAGYRGDRRHGRLLLPALWLLVLLVFFTLAASKLPSYILPALPAAAVLAAEPLTTWLEPAPPGGRLRGTGAMILLVILAGGMVLFAVERQSFGSIPASFKAALLPVCFAGLLGTLFALSSLILQRPRLAFLLLLGGNVILIFSLLLFGFPILEPWKSSRQAAEAVRPMIQPADRVLLYRDNRAGFAYYLGRVPEQPRRETELVAAALDPTRFFCLMERDRFEKLRARRPDLPLYLLTRSGQSVVVTNRSPTE